MVKNGECLKLIKLFFLLVCMFFYQKSLAIETKNPVIFELKDGYYNRWDNFKWVENHTIKIYQDGKVHYHENKKAELSKPNSIHVNHYAQLTKDQLDELIIGFLSLPFKELPKYEEKSSPDIFFHLTISLKLYYVEMYVDNVLLHRAFLTKLKKYISKDLSAWLCNPTEHDKDFIKSCERQNFLPDDFKF